MATFKEIIDRTYEILGENSDSITYSKNRVKDKINMINQTICNGFYTDIATQRKLSAGNMSFIEKKFIAQFLPPTITTESIDSSSTSIRTNTLNYSANGGYLYKDGFIISYTGKTDTHLTGVSGVPGTYLPGSYLAPVVKLPSDLVKIQNFEHEINYISSLYDYQLIDPRYHYGFSGDIFSEKNIYYTIINQGLDSYLMLLNIHNYQKIVVNYISKPKLLVSDTDILEMPDLEAKDILPLLVAGELLFETEEIALAQEKLQIGVTKLSNFYQTQQRGKNARQKSFKANW